MTTLKIGPSIIAGDYSRLGEVLGKIDRSGADFIHIDVMDGNFVPNITIGAPVIAALRAHSKLPFNVHLMIEHPWLCLNDFIKAGASSITLHAECYGKRKNDDPLAFPKVVDLIDIKSALRDIEHIQKAGVEAGLAINPDTPLCFNEILDKLDLVMLMTVNPGFSGQHFINSVVPKITELRKKFKKDIAIDGGINDKTGKLCIDAGANMLAVGSYFFKFKEYKDAINIFKKG